MKKKCVVVALAAVLASVPVVSFAYVPSYSVSDDDDDDSSSSSSSSSGSSSSSSGSTSSVITAGSGQTIGDVSQGSSAGPGTSHNQGSNATYNSVVTAGTQEKNQSNANAVSNAAPNQNVAVQVGSSSVESTVAQTAAGSVSGNTITEAKSDTTVAGENGEYVMVVSTAVSQVGGTRSLLAVGSAGTIKAQTAAAAAANQNAATYADGTQVYQKSGANELEGFVQNVIADEQKIKDGTQSMAQVYNGKAAGIDLNGYEQVGAAVTYGVKAAQASAATSFTQYEQTDFRQGQELVAMIVDETGAVTHANVVVGANGIVKYQIPNRSCIVRFLAKRA